MNVKDDAPRGRPAAQEVSNLGRVGAELLDEARSSQSGRAARTLVPGAQAPLKQTLFALAAGHALGEHDPPTAATLMVVSGRVRLVAGEQQLELGEGDHVPIPSTRHHVECLDDAVVLLTVTP